MGKERDELKITSSNAVIDEQDFIESVKLV